MGNKVCTTMAECLPNSEQCQFDFGEINLQE